MFYVQKRKSVKTGKEYIGLFCDLGYRVACVFVDRPQPARWCAILGR